MTNVANLFDPDRHEVERLASSIERDTQRLMELVMKPATREIVGENLMWFALSGMRLNTVWEDFHDRR